MKSVYVVLLLASLLALAHAFPGKISKSDDSDESKSSEDVVLVLPSGPRLSSIFDQIGDDDDDDEPSMPGMWHPFKFESSPFEGLFTRMQEAMNRIRAQMAAALASQLGQGGLTPWGKIPEGANTTSTTKVIGDHSVTINETTYTDGDENGGTVFRVRVIDVKPLNETTDATEPDEPSSTSPDQDREELTTPGSRSVESLEDLDNEIPKSQVDTLTA